MRRPTQLPREMTYPNDANVTEWIYRSSRFLIKKLSRNDCSWADGHGHQFGCYIPRDLMGASFFPSLVNVNSAKPHIFESQVKTIWPNSGEIRESRLVHYSNKGNEVHFTGVPRDEFACLTPASLLVGGVLTKQIGDVSHWFMIVDASTETAELLESIFNLDATFHFGLFDPTLISNFAKTVTELLIEEIEEHIRNGTLPHFIASVARLPEPSYFAVAAQQQYMLQHGLENLDPYLLANPGDAIMSISRDIEFKLYKQAELRHRAAEVIRIVTAGGTNIVSAIIRGFPELDATFLSASQHRKSRGGRSFEFHVARLLSDGNIEFEEQAITGGRRPDFVLPSLQVLNSKKRSISGAMVLSVKTTLRERWKQVALERFACEVYLGTVDDRVSSAAILDMATHGICLVVPESLKTSKETCYKEHSNVINFREFFDKKAHFMRKTQISSPKSLF